jgi:NAD(P)-dependent dehydrogenase (short-subunit alcohol dehydrogenase family)
MIVVKLARALESEGFTVLALHPGMVDTEMGHAVAEILPKESAEKS